MTIKEYRWKKDMLEFRDEQFPRWTPHYKHPRAKYYSTENPNGYFTLQVLQSEGYIEGY